MNLEEARREGRSDGYDYGVDDGRRKAIELIDRIFGGLPNTTPTEVYARQYIAGYFEAFEPAFRRRFMKMLGDYRDMRKNKDYRP